MEIGDNHLVRIMRLSEMEIVNLLDFHASSLADLACDVVQGTAPIAALHAELERLHELVAALASVENDGETETRTMQ